MHQTGEISSRSWIIRFPWGPATGSTLLQRALAIPCCRSFSVWAPEAAKVMVLPRVLFPMASSMEA